MNKELERVYEAILYQKKMALKGSNAYKADILDDIIGLIEDADEHFSCRNCKSWNDGECDEEPTEPWDMCSRYVEDLWAPREGEDEDGR
jgi:hypothetical protein